MRWFTSLSFLLFAHGVLAGAPERATLRLPTAPISPIVVCNPILEPEPFSQTQPDLYGIQNAAEEADMEVILIDEECRPQNIAASRHSQ